MNPVKDTKMNQSIIDDLNFELFELEIELTSSDLKPQSEKEIINRKKEIKKLLKDYS